MRYRKYGSTGITVSSIGFGGMRFEKPDDLELSASLVTQAYEAGINYFDTAPGYGKSEDIFGLAFKTMAKTRTQRPFYVSTKTFAEKPGEARKDLETSLKRTGLDHIDFYHSWCVMSYDEYVYRRDNGIYKEFQQLKDEGLVKHLCLSTHADGADIAKILDDNPPFEGILLGCSALNFRYREKGIEAASKKGLGVVVMNPLGGGLIPQNPDRFSFLNTQNDETVVEAALRFLLNDSRITLPLVGFSNTTQLQEALKAVEGFLPISDERVKKMVDAMAEALNSLCTNCGYCSGCPQHVPIQKLMDAYNHYILSNRSEKALIDRLKWHWSITPKTNEARLCSLCGRCEELCTQKLPVSDRITEIRRILKAQDDK